MDINFIIPAIDIIDGKCVRLTQGDFSQQQLYHTDPVGQAKRLEEIGFQRLHVVDLDGARYRRLKHLHILESITSQTSLQVDYGGGVNTKENVRDILNAGAAMITLGSLAVKKPLVLQEWVEEFGADYFFIGADVKNNAVRIHGWKEDTGVDVFRFIADMRSMGLSRFFCTDISKDGMLEGPSLSLYRTILETFPGIDLVASGGVSCEQDLHDLKELGCTGAIVGKALYEGRLNVIV